MIEVVTSRIPRSAKRDIQRDPKARRLFAKAIKAALAGDRIGAASLADSAILAVDVDPWWIDVPDKPLDISILEGS